MDLGKRRMAAATLSESDDSSDEGQSSTWSNSKKPRMSDNSDANYSEFAQRMMREMGHKKGKGLGKHGQGRVDIVEASKQRGTRGLGLHLEGLEGDAVEWSEELNEPFQVKIYPDWIPPPERQLPEKDELFTWCSLGPEKKVIDEETQFCDPKVLENILKSKTIFDKLGNHEFLRARSRANAVETVRSGIFQNRAAMKMAELDSSFDFMFTRQRDNFNDLTYFADICAGPGGFSEYVLWRLKWQSKGFGLTLKADGANDFKIDDFLAGTPETFETHYGKGGYHGDGDIFKEENLTEFRKFVLESTDNKGVHFVMADGGFSVEGQENIQEILSKQLYLCQFLCALSILRPGGHFVCKLFDIFTEFSVGLIYLLNHTFEKTCIFKPHTSRPANSERYVVCKSKQANVDVIHDYLFMLNQKINALKRSKEDVMQIVPLSILKDDFGFYNYIYNSNNSLGEKQVRALTKIRIFVQNTNLPGENQGEIRKQCLQHWNIPDEARAAHRRQEPDVVFRKLIEGLPSLSLSKDVQLLTTDSLQRIPSTLDHECIVSGGPRLYILGLGRMHNYKWNVETTHERRWIKLGLFIEFPRDTLIEGEIVQELRGEGRGQRRVQSIQVIDGLYLGGTYIGDKTYDERISKLQLFVKALQKPTRRDMAPLSVKQTYRLSDANDIFSNLSMKQMKERDETKLCFLIEHDRYFVPSGMHIVSTIREPWIICQSRSQKRAYYFNTKANSSTFDFPVKGAVATYQYCLDKRLYWKWEDRLDINLIPHRGGEVSKHTFLKTISDIGKKIGLPVFSENTWE